MQYFLQSLINAALADPSHVLSETYRSNILHSKEFIMIIIRPVWVGLFPVSVGLVPRPVPAKKLVLWTSTQFQPIRQGFNPKKVILGCNRMVTTRQILTRLNILGFNPFRVATRWVGNGLNLKNQKIPMYGSFVDRIKFYALAKKINFSLF
jgi:hypothetical protein